MDLDDDSFIEKKVIEEYLSSYCLEDCLDEALNNVVITRPSNPYSAIAAFLCTKTTPEILDVHFSSILTNGQSALRVTLVTNIDSFYGVISCQENTLSSSRDYSLLEEKARAALINLNPCNLANIDDVVAKIPDVESYQCMAISIACCRAAARHSGVQPYNIINELLGSEISEISLPVPVVTVISRLLTPGVKKNAQDITLTPLTALSLDDAMEALVVTAADLGKLDFVRRPLSTSNSGGLCVESPSILSTIKTLRSFLVDGGLVDSLGIGVELRASELLKQPVDTFSYVLDLSVTPVIAKGGAEMVEALVALWQEVEFVSIENPLAHLDITALSLFKKRTQETIFDCKSVNSGKLKYCAAGVGGDSDCGLQVLLDDRLFAENLQDVNQMPYNCLKIQLSTMPSLSRAVSLCKKAKKANWAVAAAINGAAGDNLESVDCILADFAVGVGASQMMGGGLHGEEFCSHYNRLLDIARGDGSIRYNGPNFRVK